MASVSSTFYWGTVVFFTIVFIVFFAIAYSVVFGIVRNYQTYYQKADLQWTGPAGAEKRPSKSPGRLLLLLVLSLATAWSVVHFLIFHP